MKLLMLEHEPRVHGVTTFSAHLKRGLQALGVEVDHVVYTKSGRSRRRWSERRDEYGTDWAQLRYDDVWKTSEVSERAREYDGCVVAEPTNRTQDSRSMRGSFPDPAYVEVMESLGDLPWVTHSHDDGYTDPPYLARVLRSPGFRGFTATRERHVTGAMLAAGKPHRVVGALPFDASAASYVECDGSIGYVGRVDGRKGARIIAEALEIGFARDFTIYGASSVTPYACATYAMAERLAAAGYEVRMPAGKHRPEPWEARRGARTVRYRRTFGDVSETFTFSVGVFPTSSSLQSGMIEYACLEQMARGCACVIPEHMSPPEGGYVTATYPEGDAAAMVSACDSAKPSRSDWERNLETVRERNDPKVCARAMLELLGGTR